ARAGPDHAPATGHRHRVVGISDARAPTGLFQAGLWAAPARIWNRPARLAGRTQWRAALSSGRIGNPAEPPWAAQFRQPSAGARNSSRPRVPEVLCADRCRAPTIGLSLSGE